MPLVSTSQESTLPGESLTSEILQANNFVHASLQYILPNEGSVDYRVGQSDIVRRLDGLRFGTKASSEQLRVEMLQEGSTRQRTQEGE